MFAPRFTKVQNAPKCPAGGDRRGGDFYSLWSLIILRSGRETMGNESGQIFEFGGAFRIIANVDVQGERLYVGGQWSRKIRRRWEYKGSLALHEGPSLQPGRQSENGGQNYDDPAGERRLVLWHGVAQNCDLLASLADRPIRALWWCVKIHQRRCTGGRIEEGAICRMME